MPDDKPNISNPFGSPAPAQDEVGDQIFLGTTAGEAYDDSQADAGLPVPGEYRCRCIGAENKDSSNGNPMIVLTYKIVGNPKYTDTEFTSNVVLMQKTMKRVSRTFKAFGIDANGKVSVSISAFVNKEVMLTLAHREWQDSTYVDVKSIRACPADHPMSAQPLDDDIPF